MLFSGTLARAGAALDTAAGLAEGGCDLTAPPGTGAERRDHRIPPIASAVIKRAALHRRFRADFRLTQIMEVVLNSNCAWACTVAR